MKLSDIAVFRKSFVIATILLLLISMLTAVGTTYGRYITVVSAESNVNVKPKPTPYVFGGEEWVSEPLSNGIDVQKLTFTVGNYFLSTVDETVMETVEERDFSVTVRIFAPVSDLDGTVHVRLTCADSEYLAVPEKVDINSFIGKKYGEGVIYRFFDSDGYELVWELCGGIKTEFEMTASVTGAVLSDENGEFDYKLSVESIFTE